ncbi:proprotein convertase subtilisin/kexin type 6-like [Tubulanus polymorphus]|uniref:proprotein convertase subtilisin/kexin type 6-like n=1 Tax=Tubulanus polymorphus TaxID=672921 RepID=UPI003DA1DC5D
MRFSAINYLFAIITINTIIDRVKGQVYLNKFAVEIEGGHHQADRVAEQLGFINLGQVGSLENHYIFEHHQIEKRSAVPHRHHHIKLITHSQVLWSEQQVAKKRVKRDYIEKTRRETPGVDSPQFHDPLYSKEWYLHGGGNSGYDMNVKPAWAKGYTGKGVVVTLLDDGLEHNHTDLYINYDPEASYDINDNDNDPMPRYDDKNENRHGTRCAGEVSAIANNNKCGVGVAYNARIGGVRMLDGDVSDVVEASSLSLNRQHIDIYSASWGPDDNGKVVDGPAALAKKAFQEGAKKGRNGKGSIFVWASGNGGNNDDSCNCDGYTNSVYTLSISSVSENNKKPWYLEECSSTLATTYSSGENLPIKERQIVTTDLRNQCTESHTGTSASAPLAAGICALALEANPSLTWRDLQHIVVLTANPAPMIDGEWIINGVGRKVSLKYGYGLMDASAMVDLAEVWSTVPPQHVCSSVTDNTHRLIEGGGIAVSIETNGCHDRADSTVRFLEHVQLKLSLRYSRRGALKILLLSPNGTESTLLVPRKHDTQAGEFDRWPLMSVQYWGENPSGKWTLTIQNTGSMSNNGELLEWQIIMYGTEHNPVTKHTSMHHKNGRSKNSRVTERTEMNPTTQYDSDYFDQTTDPDYYGNDQLKCNVECLSGCHGPSADECVDCRHFRIRTNGRCVSQCPDTGYYSNPEQRSCIQCDQSCWTCIGPDRTQCSSCADGFYFIDQLGTCAATCPDEYYADVSAMTCKQCDPTCQTCRHRADKCTSCPGGASLDQNRCVTRCRMNQFRGANGGCYTCSSKCKECTGSTDRNCISCLTGAFFINGTCVSVCPPGFYGNKLAAECLSCDGRCKTCSGPEYNQCLSCKPNLQLNNAVCIRSVACKPDEYKDESGICHRCHNKCKTCSSETRFDCLSCKQNMYLDQGECVSHCGRGYYIHTDRGQDASQVSECRECHMNCRRCSGGRINECTKCEHGLVLSNGECQTKCNSGFYPDVSSVCKRCSKLCIECTGLSSNECTVCATGKVLLSGRCLNNCPAGYYKSLKTQCLKCHRTCRSCSDEGPRSCRSCNHGYMLINGICQRVPSCPLDKYYSISSKECKSCDPLCRTCQGRGSSNCTSCYPTRVYNEQSRECVLCCSDTVRDNCCNCHPDSGICLEDRNIKELSPLEVGIENRQSPITGSDVLLSSHYFGVVAVMSCIVIVCLYFVVFGALQLYSNGLLCFKPEVRYQALPTKYNHHTDKILLTKDDYNDDEEGDNEEEMELYPGDEDVIID